uniref:Glycosyl transferase family 3 domain-containing protein n=1 Tax=Aegilops tauschii subsp. strangulata TaxID=200361 RepID=A0A453J0Q8_AEGTS
EQLIGGADFTEDEAEATLQLLLNEKNEARIAAFLVLLRAKGETYDEIVGLAKAMMRNCVLVEGLHDAVDIVGTGGDGADTVNISTGSTILAAAAGAKVAKQGSRASSSACGSADVLEALGVNIELGPEVLPDWPYDCSFSSVLYLLVPDILIASTVCVHRFLILY